MRILVCGWLGSTNLGDELVFAGVRSLIAQTFGSPTICAVSIDPQATVRDHGVTAIDHRRVDRIERAARTADLVVLGGGGLIQDRTSALNLPYHLSRLGLAALGSTPLVALALGVGPLTTRLGRRLASSLRWASAVTVRDEPSRELLAGLGVPAELAADAAFHLDWPTEADIDIEAAGGADAAETAGGGSEDVIAVSLRPWSTRRHRLPVGWRRGGTREPAWFVPTLAKGLEAASRSTGLPIRFLALQSDRDHLIHRAVAEAMDTPTELAVPSSHSLSQEIGRARVVVGMRYHAGIAATLSGKPSVLIGYDPKVDALAETLGEGARHLPFDPAALASIGDAIEAQLRSAAAPSAVLAAASSLRSRARTNADALRRAAATS